MEDRSISRQYRWKVKGRLAVLDYAASHGIKPAAARFALDRKMIRAWRTCAHKAGPVGLVPRYPKRRRRRIAAEVVELIAHARREHPDGMARRSRLIVSVSIVQIRKS